MSGKITKDTKFAADDHRNYNRYGEKFDRGETFSGIDLDVALMAVEEIRQLLPEGVSMANFALRWILDHPAVSCVIPGARNARQISENVTAAELSSLSAGQMAAIFKIYQERIQEHVHHRW